MDPTEGASPDLAIGSFSDHGPWVVDPDAMAWRADVDRRARPGADSSRAGSKPGALPPIGPGRPGRRPGRRRARAAGTPIDRREGRRSRPARPRPPAAPRVRRARADLHQARPDHLGRRRPVPRGAGRPSSSCCATACRPSRSTSCAGSSSSISAARSTTCSSASTARRSRRRRSRRCTRPGCAPAKKSSSRCSGRRSRGSCAKTSQAMSWLAPRLVGRIPVAALANPPALVELFAETIVEELDFCLEAREHARHRARARGDRASAPRSCPARTRRS